MNKDTNYIVSGLERSGTSLMMQILKAGGVPVAYDEKRKSDKGNPNGYFELENGKIIDKLKAGTFPMEKYKGKFIKVTAWGLQFLPKGKYEIIYMIRDMGEIVDSTEKMANRKMSLGEKNDLMECLADFQRLTFKQLESKQLMYIPIFHKCLITPCLAEEELEILAARYGSYDIVKKGLKVIDERLYRSRSNGKD
jgi:hypothetical protein